MIVVVAESEAVKLRTTGSLFSMFFTVQWGMNMYKNIIIVVQSLNTQ